MASCIMCTVFLSVSMKSFKSLSAVVIYDNLSMWHVLFPQTQKLQHSALVFHWSIVFCDKGDVTSVAPPLLIISLKDDLDNRYLCFEGVVGTRTEGARLGATGWDDVFLKPSSSVSGLVISWARWISSFLLHWKHKAVASAPSEFGSGCFKPSKIRANFCYYFNPH